jgi:hypothetical protein
MKEDWKNFFVFLRLTIARILYSLRYSNRGIILDEEIIRKSQQEVVTNVLKNIDQVYRQIKKNELSPGTEYLFR